MHDLERFSVADLEAIAAAFRHLGSGGRTMEQVGQRMVDYFHRELRSSGAPAVVLARLYRTMVSGSLDATLRRFAEAIAQEPLAPEAACLVLVASAGEEREWNDRRKSRGHAAIPLRDPAAVHRSPMVAELFRSLGFDVDVVLQAKPHHYLHHERDRGVFFVPDAEGDPSIPAQDGFVRPYGVRSVIGVGGFLPSGDVYALILFLRVRVQRSVAELFTTIGITMKASLTPHTYTTF